MSDDVAPRSEAALVPYARALAPRDDAAVAPYRLGRRLAPVLRLFVRLPVLWGGGRGPLAHVAAAGGFLALSTLVVRVAAGPLRALAPALLRGGDRPVRVETSVETLVGTRRRRFLGRSTTEWQRQRLKVVHYYPPVD